VAGFAGIVGAIASLDRGKGIPHDRGEGLGLLLGDPQGAPCPESGMTILWSPEAIDDLQSARVHIAADDPAAAKRIALHILHCVEELLPENPQLGHPGRVPGTRELVIGKTPFIVPYRINGRR
jgi:toxin ParE1/3/4